MPALLCKLAKPFHHLARYNVSTRTIRRTEEASLAGQNAQSLSVVDHVVVHPIQRLVLVVEPFPEQLRGRYAGHRLLKQVSGAAKWKPEITYYQAQSSSSDQCKAMISTWTVHGTEAGHKFCTLTPGLKYFHK